MKLGWDALDWRDSPVEIDFFGSVGTSMEKLTVVDGSLVGDERLQEALTRTAPSSGGKIAVDEYDAFFIHALSKPTASFLADLHRTFHFVPSRADVREDPAKAVLRKKLVSKAVFIKLIEEALIKTIWFSLAKKIQSIDQRKKIYVNLLPLHSEILEFPSFLADNDRRKRTAHYSSLLRGELADDKHRKELLGSFETALRNLCRREGLEPIPQPKRTIKSEIYTKKIYSYLSTRLSGDAAATHPIFDYSHFNKLFGFRLISDFMEKLLDDFAYAPSLREALWQAKATATPFSKVDFTRAHFVDRVLRGDVVCAAKIAQKIVAVCPEHAREIETFEQIFLQDRSLSERLQLLEDCVRVAPDVSFFHLVRGQDLFQNGDRIAGIAALSCAVELEERTPVSATYLLRARHHLAAVHLEDGNFAEAVTILEALADQQPSEGIFHRLYACRESMGMTALSNEDTAAAVLNFQEALAIGKTIPISDERLNKVRKDLVKACISAGRFEQAADIVADLPFKSPTNRNIGPFLAECHLKIGRSRLKNGDTAAAIASLQDGVQCVADAAFSKRLVASLKKALAEAYLSAGQFEAAAGILTEFVETKRDNLRIRVDLARCWEELGQLDRAISSLEGVIETGRGNAAILTKLGSLYRRSNRIDDALAAYQGALDQMPSSKKLQRAIANLTRRKEKRRAAKSTIARLVPVPIGRLFHKH